MLEKALEVEREALGDEHWLTARARSALAAALAARGHYGEAEPLLLDAYAKLRAQRGDGDRYVEQAREQLHALYTAWDKPARATEYARDE